MLGLLLGAAAGGAAIYYNPLIGTKAPAQPDPADRALHYSLPSEVLGFALGEQVVPPGTPKRDDLLWEETIDRTAMLSLVLDDAHDKPAAIASRMLAVSPRTDFVLSGVRVNDYWLLTIPGEGTLFLRADDEHLAVPQRDAAGVVPRQTLEGPGGVQPDVRTRRAWRGRGDWRDGALRGSRGHGDREVSAHGSRPRGTQRGRHR